MTTLRRVALASLLTSAAVLAAAPAMATPPAHAGKPTDVRVLAWNIYHGGLDDNWDDVDNRQEVIDQIVEVNPDVFFSVETYGAGDAIVDGLEKATGKDWAGVQITPSSTGNDNLWLFTHFDVDEVFPAPTGYQETGSFHLGGARVIADDGRADQRLHHVEQLHQPLGRRPHRGQRPGRRRRPRAERPRRGDRRRRQAPDAHRRRVPRLRRHPRHPRRAGPDGRRPQHHARLRLDRAVGRVRRPLRPVLRPGSHRPVHRRRLRRHLPGRQPQRLPGSRA